MIKRRNRAETAKGGRFYEFFAGGGMARAGLGDGWQCVFANDIDEKKAQAYARNWGAEVLRAHDVAALSTKDLPGHADLAWASFPCQDLSLAGNGAGLKGTRSGTFWPFWNLMKGLRKEGRAPRLIVLENVYGALTSHGGRDFGSIIAALADEQYRFGPLVVDAAHFLPQSRPRLFIIAAASDISVPSELMRDTPEPAWSPAALMDAHGTLSRQQRERWIWWMLPAPPRRTCRFADLVEEGPLSIRWHTKQETERLLELMSPLNRAKVEEERKSCARSVGTIYKRSRPDGSGKRVQRAEIRFDGVAGCLRTPTGGSSRQFVMFVEDGRVRSRLLSPREAARLMGLPENYMLPDNYNEAYHLSGDGVAVPVVRHIAAHLLEPLLASAREHDGVADE